MRQSKFHRDIPACPYCGQPLMVVEVHGHSQCVICKNNVNPCCQGQQNCEESNESHQKVGNKSKKEVVDSG